MVCCDSIPRFFTTRKVPYVFDLGTGLAAGEVSRHFKAYCLALKRPESVKAFDWRVGSFEVDAVQLVGEAYRCPQERRMGCGA